MGRESFGSDWNDECTHDEDSELRRVALKNLRLALQSGTVQAIWYGDRSEHVLTPIEAAGEYFRIDLESDCINLSFFAGEPIRAAIHAEDLKAFIRNNGEVPPVATVGAKTACRKWIVARITNEERVKPKEFLWAEARRQFTRLSRRAFEDARKEAISETGRTDIGKGGRPSTKPSSRET